jgi:hypothetical protein
LPSSEVATFQITNGVPVVTWRSKPVCLGCKYAVVHVEARRTQTGEARAVDQGVRIGRADHHASDAGVDQGLGARRCGAVVVAGLQGADDRRATRPVTRLAERADLGMRRP